MTEDLHAAALAQGYEDETCSTCGTLFLAHVHFVRCAAPECPMRSTKNRRTLLEMLMDQDAAAGKEMT